MGHLFDIIGVSGLIAIVGGLIGYGRLSQRVSAVEEATKKSGDNAESLARLEAKFEERTGAIMRDLEAIKKAVAK